jgi:hypothetical protein
VAAIEGQCRQRHWHAAGGDQDTLGMQHRDTVVLSDFDSCGAEDLCCAMDGLDVMLAE